MQHHAPRRTGRRLLATLGLVALVTGAFAGVGAPAGAAGTPGSGSTGSVREPGSGAAELTSDPLDAPWVWTVTEGVAPAAGSTPIAPVPAGPAAPADAPAPVAKAGVPGSLTGAPPLVRTGEPVAHLPSVVDLPDAVRQAVEARPEAAAGPAGLAKAAGPPGSEAAVDATFAMWGARLPGRLPVRVSIGWQPMGWNGGGVLAMAGSPMAAVGDTAYAMSIAEHLLGRELNGTGADIEMVFNTDAPWYYGTDTALPSGQIDFITVAAHELGHGLGFAGCAAYSGGSGRISCGGGLPASAWDLLVRTADGTPVTQVPSGSALGQALTSNALSFVGTRGMAAAGGALKLYAPANWEGGSSYSHLDESTYNRTSPLMTPRYDRGLVLRSVDDITWAMLLDVGWSGEQVAPNPQPSPVPPPSPGPSPSPDPTPDPDPGVPVERVAGSTRYETAVRIADATPLPPNPTVLVATGRNWPDGILAGAAAKAVSAPVVLVEPDSIPEVTADALRRLRPGKIVVLGGTEAVRTEVAEALGAFTSGPVERLGGADRYETAALLMRWAFVGKPIRSIFVAGGGGDHTRALLAAAQGAFYNGPALLVPPGGELPASVQEALSALVPEQMWIVGDPSSVSNDAERALGRFGPVFRDGAGDLGVLSAQVWDVVQPGEAAGVVLATQENFPDALVGAGFAGLTTQPLALVPKTCVPSPVLELISRLGVSKVTILGGPMAVDPAVDSLQPC